MKRIKKCKLVGCEEPQSAAPDARTIQDGSRNLRLLCEKHERDFSRLSTARLNRTGRRVGVLAALQDVFTAGLLR